MKDATGQDIAEVLITGRHRIARFAAKTVAPFLAGIYKTDAVKAYEINGGSTRQARQTLPI